MTTFFSADDMKKEKWVFLYWDDPGDSQESVDRQHLQPIKEEPEEQAEESEQ
jgi:hypothetical protein